MSDHTIVAVSDEVNHKSKPQPVEASGMVSRTQYNELKDRCIVQEFTQTQRTARSTFCFAMLTAVDMTAQCRFDAKS
jgi:hypothetical protein